MNLWFYIQFLIQTWDGDVQVRIPKGTPKFEETKIAITIGDYLYPAVLFYNFVLLIDLRVSAARIIKVDVEKKKAAKKSETGKTK